MHFITFYQRVFIMKLNLKKLMIVLTVAMLASTNTVKAKDKSVEDCIQAAECIDTLEQHLNENGHNAIAKSFKPLAEMSGFKQKIAAAKIYTSQSKEVQNAISKNSDKLKEIIAAQAKKKKDKK